MDNPIINRTPHVDPPRQPGPGERQLRDGRIVSDSPTGISSPEAYADFQSQAAALEATPEWQEAQARNAATLAASKAIFAAEAEARAVDEAARLDALTQPLQHNLAEMTAARDAATAELAAVKAALK
jgi:hypothetical protein